MRFISFSISIHQKKGILLACLSMLFVLAFISVIGLRAKQPKTYTLELASDTVLQELEKEIVTQNQQPVKQTKSPKPTTHKSYNTTAKKNVYQKELDDFKTLEELMQDRAQSTQNTPADALDITKKAFSKSAIENGVTTKKNAQQIAKKQVGEIPKISNTNPNSTIYYALKDRVGVRIKNPIYTCPGSGKVTLTITVNAAGVVVDAVYNSTSTTSNACMVENAIAYALRSSFSTKKGMARQIGTITYWFQEK